MIEKFADIPAATVERMVFPLPQGPRVPRAIDATQVLCRFEPTHDPLPGLVMIGAHLDTINMTGPADLNLPAPRRNDDASGIAAMLEVARIMATRPRRHPLLFVGFGAEEQGLVGSAALASRAKRKRWVIDASCSATT